MQVITLLTNIILWAVFGFLLLNGLYLLFFSLAGKAYRPPALAAPERKRRIGVLMPVYKNDAVIASTAVAALHHRYEGEHSVIVIADSLMPETVAHLRTEGVEVLEIELEKRTKGRALQWLSGRLAPEAFDSVMVLDVDNVMDAGVLNDVNAALESGYRVVQAHRTSFRPESALMFLDACNEEISNHLFRRGPVALGLSSALIGSGMAFDWSFFCRLVRQLDDTVGEDKELDFQIAIQGQKIAYLENTRVRDEKISGDAAFRTQRARWLAAQLSVLKKYTPMLTVRQLWTNKEFLNKLAHAWLVPRMLLIGSLILLLLLSMLIHSGPQPLWWALVLGLVVVSLLISLPLRFYRNPLFLRALGYIPRAIVLMITALFRMQKAGKRFVATEHGR